MKQIFVAEAAEQKIKVAGLEGEVAGLKLTIQHQESLLNELKNELQQVQTKPVASNSAEINLQSAVNGMPTSCGDLRLMGHTLSGMYSVMGAERFTEISSPYSGWKNSPRGLPRNI